MSTFADIPVRANDDDITADWFNALRLAGIIASKYYDAVCGSGGSAGGCTHASLAAALADSAILAGSRILVISSETTATINTISKANIAIEFAPGITFTAGAATTCIQISAGGVRIRGARFSGFSRGVQIDNGYNNCFILENRFASCTDPVFDLNSTPNNVIFNNLSEL